MFSQYKSAALFLLAATLLIPLVGCDSNSARFAQLDSQNEKDASHRGVLMPSELNFDQDEFITPEELRGARTYPRKVDQFFEDGGSTAEKGLTQAQFDKAVLGNQMPGWQIAVIALLAIAIPLPIGFQMAKSLRMPDYGWQISLILLTITCGGAIAYFGWPPKQGIDLSGGVILIYEIDAEATKDQLGEDAGDGDTLNSEGLAQQLRRRINPGGVNEIVVRPYGPQQVEIIIPNVEEAEIELIKKRIEKTGQLEFLIVANQTDDKALRTQAIEDVAQLPSTIKNAEGKTYGRWVPVGVTEATQNEQPNYRYIKLNDVIRARQGGADRYSIVSPEEISRMIGDQEEPNYKQIFDQLGYQDVQVLLRVNPLEHRNVKGQHLRTAAVGSDNVGRPAVRFYMTGPGAKLLGTLTNENMPDDKTGFHRQMAIVMDNEVISAPSLNDHISDTGIITGDFTREEVQELVNVLVAGRLPAVMRKDPISENRISSLLGADTIRSGAFAISLSLFAVLIFMLVYYRFAGIVACAALMLNLLLILALMILLKATFTLPGIAGLVLTVGMSVDANVLIFERIREELARGAALRMAIRNGFQRATVTIVDANLTTLITGIVLYVIGTDQIRGFAVTLILGILMSMFTAIFCSRVVFDIAERKRWISSLNMMQIIRGTNFDFIGLRKIAGTVSMILIVVGMAALVARGRGILDIDFNGGTSVQILLKSPMAIDEMRDKVEEGNLGDVSVVGVPITDAEDPDMNADLKTGEYVSYIINSSITGEEPPEVGDPIRYRAKGDTDAHAYTVVSVDDVQETADLKSFRGKEYKDVAWEDIERDGVAVVQKRIMELFPNELKLHSMTVSEVAAITKDEPPVVEQPSATDTPDSNVDPADIDIGTPDTTPEDTTPKDTTPVDEGDLPTDDTTPPADETPADVPDVPGDVATPSETGDAPATDDTPTTDDAPAPDATTPDETPAPDETPDVDESSDARTRNPFSLASYRADEELLAQADGVDDIGDPATDDGAVTPGETDEPEAPIDEGSPFQGRTKASLAFDHKMTAASVRDLIGITIRDKYPDVTLPKVRASNPQWDGNSGEKFDEWTVEVPLSQTATQEMLSEIEAEQAGSPVWLSSNKIGGQVAGNLQQQAIVALLVCLVGIIGYIWLRFQRVVFGLAAVVALVHDVLITLGAIAVSLWVAKMTMGVLLVDEFKISLPIVAALLTIIGYSLNDTIVVFDRIREVRGKNPELTKEMINTSINQTLSRTLLTSLTTLIVVLLLYILGGQAIRGFAFALLIGVIVGTYSSVFVASPALLWMMNASKETKVQSAKSKATTEV